MLDVLDLLGLALATNVVAGKVADDSLYGPIYQRIRQPLDKSGLLYIGDSKWKPYFPGNDETDH